MIIIESPTFQRTREQGRKLLLFIKQDSLDHDELKRYYADPLFQQDPGISHMCFCGLLYNGKKISATMGKHFLQETFLRPNKELMSHIHEIIVADASYFKLLSGRTKITDCYGEKLQCQLKGFEQKLCVYVPNYRSIFYNPKNEELIKTGLKALVSYQSYDIIKSGEWAYDMEDAVPLLKKCLNHPSLTCDIEATGLGLGSEIISIAFAWNEHEGIALYHFPKWYPLLKFFFEECDKRGVKLIFHRATFDLKLIIWELWMKGPFNYSGMFEGLHCFRHVECSQILTYLALNSTTEVSLGLKENSYEWAGNYGIGIKDASNVEPKKLLTYNLKDVLATWYVWKKYWPVCEKDHQLQVYREIFQPSINPLLQMMLVGQPVDLKRLDEVDQELQDEKKRCMDIIQNTQEIILYTTILKDRALKKKNDSLKVKQFDFWEFPDVVYNPNSDLQTRGLLFDYLGYEPTDFTDKGAPSVAGKVLPKLLGKGPYDHVIQALIDLAKVTIILSTFITGIRRDTVAGYLRGDYSIGGTQSGRLSSGEVKDS